MPPAKPVLPAGTVLADAVPADAVLESPIQVFSRDTPMGG